MSLPPLHTDRPSDPPARSSTDTRARRLRRGASTGAVAALAVFTGLAATGPHGTSSSAPTTAPAVGATVTDDTGAGFFQSPSVGIEPANGNVPDIRSGGS